MEYAELSRRLPLGQSSFEDLRHDGSVYVDKTDGVFSLASGFNKIFLARPRRFGKSLLVSTFYSLFRYGLRDFQGLAIEKKWHDDGKYNVLRLDFSRIRDSNDTKEFRFKLNAYLRTAFAIAGFSFPQEWGTPANNFEVWLNTQPRRSVVLLIDEYDAPLTAAMHDAQLFTDVCNELFEFFAVIKSQTGFFRFVFMTGITKFSQPGIFSVINDLTDISLSRTYATILGYTRTEIEKYFGEHIAEAAQRFHVSPDDLRQKLEEHYDGYCFDGLSGEPHIPERVYAPWSVLNFLRSPEDGFRNYWMTSGGKPQLLTQYFKDHALKAPEAYGAKKVVTYADLDGSSDLSTINDVALLTHAGYLTIEAKLNKSDLLVGYPNREVAESMAQLYTSLLLKQQTLSAVGARDFVNALNAGDVSLTLSEINKVFLAINFERYPIENEAALQACLQVFITGAGVAAIVEKHNACGRSDLEFDAGDFHWVFELKFLPASENETEAERLLAAAEQQICERHYGEDTHRKLIRVAAVFNATQRQFTRWKRVEA